MPLDERDEVRLKDMIRYARDAITLLGRMTFEEMEADLAVRLALARCVEVIGEAARKVSEPARRSLPSVPWHTVWGMRNRLIHDYGNTDYRIVFRVVRDELPALQATLEAFVDGETKPPG